MERIAALILTFVVFAVASCSSPAPPAPPANRPTSTPITPTVAEAPAPEEPQWGYASDVGPERWATLSPQFAACQAGRAQSPIDISQPLRGPTATLRALFPPAQLQVAPRERLAEAINTGNTIQINDAAADTLTIGDLKYQLVQYHFHQPSEHTLAGRQLPLEMHMVHMAPNGRVALIAVLAEEGTRNSAFEPLLSNLPTQKGDDTSYPSTSDVSALLPAVRSSYRYEGSLTMPPCSEGVKWIVMSTPIQLSADQISAFTQVITRNNRPVQPLNGRPIVTDTVTVTSGR